MTHRRVHPILAAFFLFALSVRTVFSASPDKPNILFIFMDDLNASIGGMGMHPDTRTPHMDRLRDRGVLFTNAGSNYPVCGPSRASIWSGLYPHTTGYLGHGRKWGSWRRNPVLRDSVTVFEHLRDQGGYHIYAAGKIHHNGDEDTSIFQNTDGSDGFAVKALFGPYITNGEERNAHGHPVVMTREEIQEGGCTNGDCDFGPFMQDPPIPGGTGSWVYEDGTPFRYVSETDRDLVPDEKSALQAVEWLKTHSGEKPFFMTIGILRPHSPLIVPPSYFERFPLEDIRIFPGRKLGDLADTGVGLIKPYQIQTFVGGVDWGRTKYGSILRAGGETMLKRWTQAYLAAVSFVDDRVGEILDALDASPYADNTVVILSSDHGYHMGDKDMLHKFTPWESAVRVPLIFAGPGIASGKRSGVPVSLIDIFPTLNELACVPNDPNGTGNGVPLDGHSLVPLLKQPEKGEWDGPSSYLSVIQGAFTEKPGMKGDPARQHYTLRSATHRYIRWSNGYEELYNHSKDPWEWNNIADLADKEELIMLFRDQLTDMTGIHTESD